MKMKYYVYILQSIPFPNQTYIGITTNLDLRFKTHNEGGSLQTSKYKPWELKISVTFLDKTKAYAFEKYLKSHSGRAFASKHF